MKLMIVNSRFLPRIGGGETYILELMHYFSSRGWEVHLLTNDNGYKEKTWEDCIIHTIKGFDDNNSNINLAAPQFRAIIDHVQPDLVHIHNVMPYFIYSSITSPGEFKTVVTIHNTPYLPERLFGSFNDLKTEAAFCRQLFTNGRHETLVFGSNYYLDSYAHEIPQIKDTAVVAHYFPPWQTTGPLQPKRLEGSEVRLLFPSRILRRKGIEECLQALKLLPDNFTLDLPAFSYTESDGYNLQIQSMISGLGLEQRVILPDTVTTPDKMPSHYEKADIVVIPSHYEGFGIVAVEALSWGIPVVTTGVGGLGEIIDDSTGVLVKPYDPTSLADGIVKIAQNAALRERIVSNGITRVQTNFAYQRHMDQIGDIYANALAA